MLLESVNEDDREVPNCIIIIPKTNLGVVIVIIRLGEKDVYKIVKRVTR